MKTINHSKLGGDVVNLKVELPQRKPNKSMTPEQLLLKAVTGSHKPKTQQELEKQKLTNILNGK